MSSSSKRIVNPFNLTVQALWLWLRTTYVGCVWRSAHDNQLTTVRLCGDTLAKHPVYSSYCAMAATGRDGKESR